MEKERFSPRTVTIPPLKSYTTGTADSKPLWISLVEDDPLAGVLREGTVSDNMSWNITEGAKMVWTVLCKMAVALAKRTVVSSAMILGVTRGLLLTVGTLILQTVDMKMSLAMAVKTRSLRSHDGLWAQAGISRCNSSGVGCSVALVKGRVRVGGVIEESGGS